MLSIVMKALNAGDVRVAVVVCVMREIYAVEAQGRADEPRRASCWSV